MIEPPQGFAIDDAAYRWGTLPGDIAGLRPLPAGISYFHRGLPCRTIFDFAAAGVMLSAPAPDRPVLSAIYELAPPWLWRGTPDHWLDALRARLGPPATISHEDLRGYPDPSSGVACWVNWQLQALDIGLSIYGGVRTEPFGRSIGLISLNWTDTIAAAAPFVPTWRAASTALEQSAHAIKTFRRFDLPEEVEAVGRGLESDSAEMRVAKRALYNRRLYATPQPIVDRLDRHALALWQSAVEGEWVLSSVGDSVVLRDVTVGWNEIKPAKAGGHSELSVEGWYIRMPHGTPAIATAAAALGALPGVVVEKYEGYDV